jgi:hypothetical protein
VAEGYYSVNPFLSSGYQKEYDGDYKPMKKAALAFPANRRTHPTSCIDQVVGDILSGWRYDISGLSPAMRTDYDQHLTDCGHCRRRQQIARTIDVLLISVSTLSIAAFLLAAIVIHRVELVTHIFTMHVRVSQAHGIAISLEAVAVAGLVFSTLLWILVAIATPLPGFLGGIVQERIPADLRERFSKDAA